MIKGTETEKNLLKGFAGESQAKNRYTFFAAKAREEGYEQIAEIFEETARQEEQHAKVFFSKLEGGCLEITACFPAGVVGTTEENLMAAAGGEHEEWADMYPAFAETAEKEGFKDIATAFRLIAKAEEEHEKRYLKLLENVKANKVFQKEESVFWYCRQCGYVHFGPKAPEACPVCRYPKAYFELQIEKY